MILQQVVAPEMACHLVVDRSTFGNGSYAGVVLLLLAMW
jgi:hypothetical protein